MAVRHTNRKARSNRIIGIVISVVFALFLVMGALIVSLSGRSEPVIKNEEGLDYINQVHYKLSPEIYADSESEMGKMSFYLSEDNTFCVRVEFFDENEKYIGETDYIFPEKDLQEIEIFLAGDIEKGVFDGHAVISAYDRENFNLRGENTEKVKINVNGKGR